MVALYSMFYNFGRVHQTLRVTPAMEGRLADHSGPSKKSSPSSDDSQNLLVRVQRLRLEAEDFKTSVVEELRTAIAQLEELQVRQAKRRGHGR
jgi:hypothetical protein